MRKLIARAKRAIWTYRQPLSRVPSVQAAPISDLFLWKKGDCWQTWFELTDVAGLFDAGSAQQSGAQVSILLFDTAGREFARHVVQAPRFKRMQVDISALAAECGDETGTFCVLHPATPPVVGQLGSNLVERGYVSYRYRNAPLRSYVHGNLDAISVGIEGKLERLAGASVLPREYRLQHELAGPAVYEIALVNPSIRTQDIAFEVLEADHGSKIETLTAILPPGGCHVFKVVPGNVAKRVVIKSHLVMARPLIFRIEDQKMDVLHG